MTHPAQPHLLTVSGLKKSGKTTVAEALIAGLLARGFRTGGIKSMLHAPEYALDREGTDTWRLARAGAAFVIGQSRHETMMLERHAEPRRMRELLPLVPAGTAVVVSEGLEDPSLPQWHVVALARPEMLEETLAVRGLRRERIVALSGIAANGPPSPQAPWPVFDVLDPGQREALLDRLLSALGDPRPTGAPGGPLIEDPGWRPGFRAS